MSIFKKKSVKKTSTPKALAKPTKPVKKLVAKAVKKAVVVSPVKKLLSPHQRHETDTGSVPVQISMLTKETEELVKHLKKHPKDHDSRLGLIKKVNRRRKLLNYLERQDQESFVKISAELGLKS